MFLSILKKVMPAPKLTEYQNYVFVGPHPDDIEVSSGGTVAELVRLGKSITFIIATDGCAGGTDQMMSAEDTVELRKRESMESANVLGVSDVIFLPFADGACYDKKEMALALTKELLKLKPDVVFAPDHLVASECHPDHLYVGEIVTRACFPLPWRKVLCQMGLSGTAPAPVLAYYYTDRPNTYVKTSKTWKKHLESIACHSSQFTQKELDVFKMYFGMRGKRFGLRCGHIRAEGFRALSPALQHCFPEASEY